MHTRAGIAGSHHAEALPSPEMQGVLFSDQSLTREQAIERYLTPKPGCENLTPTREKAVKEGKNFMLWLNPTTPFIAPQIRDAYKPEHLENIGRSIAENPHGQLQNCAVALNDSDHIQRFLDHLNEYFGSEITVEDLEDHKIGDFYATTIFGHNRQLGIASVNLKTSGHPDKGLRMRATGFVNPPFWQVISDQATENTGQNPDMWDRARSIVMYKNLRIRDGNPPTQEEVAKIFGVHEDQIWRAERYDALPSAIKTLVMGHCLTYSSAIEFHQLSDYYAEEDIILCAKKLAARKASGPQVMDEIKKRLYVGGLTPEARHLVEEGVITLPQAALLNKVSRYVSESILNSEFVEWISTTRPTTDQTRSKVMNKIAELQSGQSSLLSEYDDDAAEQAQAEVSAYRKSQKVAQVDKAIAVVTAYAHSARVAIGAGLIGDAIEKRPIARSASLHLVDQLLGALDNVRSAEADKIATALTMMRDYLVSSSNGLGAKISEGLQSLAEVIELESAQTAAEQARAREEIIRRFGVTTTRSVVQEGLF